MLLFLGILEVLVLARYSVFIFLSSVLLFMLAEWKVVVLVVPWWFKLLSSVTAGRSHRLEKDIVMKFIGNLYLTYYSVPALTDIILN